MTRRCDVCGEFESENVTMHPRLEICFSCIYNETDGDDVDDNTVIKIIDNAAERAYDARYSGSQGSGRYEDSTGYRESMTDAGRGHLLP